MQDKDYVKANEEKLRKMTFALKFDVEEMKAAVEEGEATRADKFLLDEAKAKLKKEAKRKQKKKGRAAQKDAAKDDL